MESLLARVTAEIGAARVTSVRLEIGALVAVAPEAMRSCFELCTRRTPLEGAALDIYEIPARGRCRRCGADTSANAFMLECVCGALDVEVVSGGELRITEVELAG